MCLMVAVSFFSAAFSLHRRIYLFLGVAFSRGVLLLPDM